MSTGDAGAPRRQTFLGAVLPAATRVHTQVKEAAIGFASTVPMVGTGAF